jgi:hypothetical protein
MKKILTALLLFMLAFRGQSQVTFYVITPLVQAIVPEHGFLPGKKLEFYSTIGKYDFPGQKMRVELYDTRDSLQLVQLNCSKVEINNGSEFKGETGALTILTYFQKLLPEAGIVIDPAANDVLKVELEALDSRMIGVGSITAHGLCQMKMTYKNVSRSYCIDITDKDKHSPISRNAFVTRKTATRVITSAAIREVIELFLMDLQAVNRS